MSELKRYLKAQQRAVDAALRRFLPRESARPATLHKAMRHPIFAGGKRLRPILCLAAAEAFGGSAENAMPAACAVEIIHTYSLVHDDLPCMDNDDLRRGKPTTHVAYGENVAVLAGDGLLTEAFAIVAQTPECRNYKTRHYVVGLAQSADSRRLIGGQVLDLEGEGKSLTKAQLVRIHEAKTAALLAGSLRLGGMSANVSPRKLEALTIFGRNLGLAFQVIDDILDVTQSTEQLGKTAGKDAAVDKATFPAIVGLEASKKEAQRLTDKALAALKPFARQARRLDEIAHYLLDRDY
ncbi:MAG: polyprenyl synthetase family protein [Roseibacillus sp.]|nr:polyprenyl synthetase family protein [Roseibacillus sp.]